MHNVSHINYLDHFYKFNIIILGMVYMDPDELKWLPYVKTWTQKLPRNIVSEDSCKIIIELFETYFESTLIFFKTHCDYAMKQVQ
jgi:dynein heavy chain